MHGLTRIKMGHTGHINSQAGIFEDIYRNNQLNNYQDVAMTRTQHPHRQTVLFYDIKCVHMLCVCLIILFRLFHQLAAF